MTDTMACENSTVTNELGYHGEGEDLIGMDEREQGEHNSCIGTMKVQENQEWSKDHKHKENMPGSLDGANEEQLVTCKACFQKATR